MSQLYSPESLPPGVTILWNTEDVADPERYIIGANFHTAELRLNQEVDISPSRPLARPQAEHAFMMSLGMRGQEQADHLRISVKTVETHVRDARRKLSKTGHQLIRKLFMTGIVEVTEPVTLAEPPSEETQRLARVLCDYPTLTKANERERGIQRGDKKRGNIKTLLGETTSYYGLRGVYDFTTWAHAAKILDSSPPRFVKPVEDQSEPAAFVWNRTPDGFVVHVFDEAQSCAQLEFEGAERHTAWLRAIAVQGGRIVLRNFFDTPSSRTPLERGELGALAITTLGGAIDDIGRLDIGNPEKALHGLHEKLGIPNIFPPFAPIRAADRSFELEIMKCVALPRTINMRDKEIRRVKSFADFDSYEHAAGELNVAPGSLRTMASTLTTRSPFPRLAGTYLMLRAADAYRTS